MEKKYELAYFPSVWFRFEVASGRTKYCQTDGLLFLPDNNRLIIIECKYQHTPDAYFQLENKYVPVVRQAFPKWTVATCEVVKWYDPSIKFPCAIRLRPEVSEVMPGEFAVHILNRP